jgi:hypothetical protein
MACEEGFVKCDVLYSNYALARLIVDYPIDQQKRIAVRQDRLDLGYIQ